MSHRAAPLLGLAALAFAAACGPAAPERPRNVVLVLIDTLRADHTSLAGYERDTTPGLRAVAGEGLVSGRHFANAPWTKPSVASILTGLLPPAHGAQWGDFDRASSGEVDVLPEGLPTLPELLRRGGFGTRAFMTNITLTPELGFARGFDTFEHLPPSLAGDALAVEKTLEALDEADGPTFVWCHLMAVHNYVAPPGEPPYTSAGRTPLGDAFGADVLRRNGLQTREQAVDTYDATIRYVDALVAGLVEGLRERHPDTLVIITSDHGEEFGEHGGYLHSRTLYNELLHVPLVLWGPGVPAGREVPRLSSSVDLLPTLLELLGLPPVPTQGASLLADGPRDAADVYAEKRNGLDARRALITERGKFIETKPPKAGPGKPPMEGEGHWESFADPAGRDDAAAAPPPPELLAGARARIEELWAASLAIFRRHTGGRPVRRQLTEEDARALRELGYMDLPEEVSDAPR